MSFDTDETSVASSRPIDLYTIVTPITTYYLTSSPLDLVVGGIVYTAATIQRDNAVTPNPQNGTRQLTVYCVLTHALAQELLVGGIPQRDVTLTITRYQQVSQQTRGFWAGHVTAFTTDGVNLKLTVPSKIDEYFAVKLPIAMTSRLCQHALYDAGCTMARSGANLVATTVASVSGTTVNVASVGGKPDEFFRYGEIVRLLDNERRSIVDHTGTAIVVDVPFRTLNNGDSIQLFAGCDHLVTTCRDKFANVINFGGHPELPTVNVSSPVGYGTIIQS